MYSNATFIVYTQYIRTLVKVVVVIYHALCPLAPNMTSHTGIPPSRCTAHTNDLVNLSYIILLFHVYREIS